MESQLSDAQLLRSSQEHPENFGILFDRYQETITRFLRRKCAGSREDIEDILQDTFLSVFQNMFAYNESLSFSSWVYRIAYNKMIDWYRRTGKRSARNIPVDDIHEHTLLLSEMGQFDEVNSAEKARELSEAITRIDSKYADIIILHYFEYKSYEDISDILQIPPGTVATRLSRAKAALGKLLSP